MTTSLMPLAPNLLLLFMLLLGIGPLALAWQDARRRTHDATRLRVLRHEARVAEGLRTRQPRQAMALHWNPADQS